MREPRRDVWTQSRSRRQGRFLAVLPLALLFGGCGGAEAPTAPASSGDGRSLSLQLETPHFRLYTDAAPEGVLRQVADRLEADLPRFNADLSVVTAGPFTVRIWQDETAWYAEVQRVMGRRVETSGYVSAPLELRVLAVPAVARNAAHELVHCVSLHLNPRIANNPRWLWETVAVYENGERVDPRTLDYMTAGQPPTLDELDADVMSSRKVYQVGFLIGEFIVARGGQAALVELVRTNGDTQSALGLSRAEFERAWYAFVRQRYGL